jgi:hypothetical protein
MSGQATLANSFLYEHCDVPAGIALKDWHPVAAPRPRPRRVRLGSPSAVIAIMRPRGAVQSP